MSMLIEVMSVEVVIAKGDILEVAMAAE